MKIISLVSIVLCSLITSLSIETKNDSYRFKQSQKKT